MLSFCFELLSSRYRTEIPGKGSEGMPSSDRFTLVAERSFIIATRDTGYRTTASAVSELVDNALQAGARHIQVYVTQEGVGSDRELNVAVLDDGTGMSGEVLRTALRFGGSSRFDDRSGQGRFGMGLPNSSVSQARRLDVFTWQRPGDVIYCYLDVDEIAAGKMREVPPVRKKRLPEWVVNDVRKTGTLVLWDQCDRLDNRKASTVASKLLESLGQLFRHFLWDGVTIKVNGINVRGVDPLFLRGNAEVARAVPFGQPLQIEVRVPRSPERTSVIEVRFSELPIAEWHTLSVDQKRELGIAKGGGVSIVRAGREIDYGWHFMGSKRKENYDDWWRCEVRFDPDLDELFGVTHSKQGITPTEELRSILNPQMEAVAHALNSRVRSTYLMVRANSAALTSPATRTAASNDRLLPPPSSASLKGGQGTKRQNGASAIKGKSSRERKAERTFEIQIQGLSTPDFYLWEEKADGRVVVTINRSHPFYEKLYAPAVNRKGIEDQFNLECLVLSAVRAEVVAYAEGRKSVTNKHRVAWSNALAAFLGE